MSGTKRKSGDLSDAQDNNKRMSVSRIKEPIETLQVVLEDGAFVESLNGWRVDIYETDGDGSDVAWWIGFINTSDNDIHARIALRCHDVFLIDILRNIYEPRSDSNEDYTFQIPEEADKKYRDSDGQLTIQIDIQYLQEASWKPTVHSHPVLTHLYNSSDTTDATFLVEGEKFKVHKCVLEATCPTLFDLVKNQPAEVATPLPGVEKEIFNVLLKSMYCVDTHELQKVSASDSELVEINEAEMETVKSILSHANKFGLVKLKLLAESILAYDIIDSESAAELLLFADSHSCALLKEEAMNYIDFQAQAVIKSSGWSKLNQSSSLLTELFEFMHGYCKEQCNKVNEGYEGWSVVTLLKKLEEYNLELDGSREQLISRCKEVP